jgi:hypothetical protein
MTTPPTPRGERPLGVTILSLLALLFGAVMVVGGLAAIALGGVFATLFSFVPFVGLLGSLAFVFIGVVILLFGVLAIGMGWGFWQGQAWAWTIALVLSLLGVLMAVVSLARGDAGSLVTILIDVALVWYYTREGVQRWFGNVGAWPAPQVDSLLNRAGAAK